MKLIMLSLLLASPALAATTTVTPDRIDAAMASARGGDTIRLAPGNYGDIRVARQKFSPPLVVEAGEATLKSFSVLSSSGVTLKGGNVAVGDAQGYGSLVRASDHVRIEGTKFAGMKRGTVIDRSHHVDVVGAVYSEMTIDGINIAGSQFVTVIGTDCSTMSTGKEHPDCVQGWSRPGMITQDVLIQNTNNRGNTQGIFFGNHIRPDKDGVMRDDGGFDRVRIIGNKVRNLYPQGIAIGDCRDCEIRDNDVQALPGARFRTNINVIRSATTTVCGNKVPDVPRSMVTGRCKRGDDS